MPILQQFNEAIEERGSENPKRPTVWKLLLMWLIPVLGMAGFLTSRLSEEINPWEHVLHIPNGVTDEPMTGTGIAGRFSRLAISEDQSHFAFSRADGGAELWDLKELNPVEVLDLPEPADPVVPSEPWRIAPYHLHFDQRNHLFLWTSSQSIFEFDATGKLLTSRKMDDPFARTLAASPLGDQIAYSLHKPSLLTWPGCDQIEIPVLEPVNTSSQRLEWLPDGQHFLFNDHLSVTLMDTREKKVVFQHFGLGEELPEKSKGDSARREWTGFHVDSRLVLGGERFVSIYSGEDALGSDPGFHAIRFYETLTGKILKTHPLPEEPRGISVNDQGLVAVIMVSDTVTSFENLVHLYDSETVEKVGELSFKLINRFPPRIRLSPVDQTLFVGSNFSWLVDLDEKAAPVKLLDHPSNTQQALFTQDGETLLTMQINLDLDVWKKRRDFSPLGAMIHGEYWAVHLLCLAGFLGVAIQTARRTSVLKETRLPVALWFVVIVTALGLGGSLADLILGRTLHSVWGEYEGTSIGRMIWKSLILLFWLRILVGLARLESAWRKTALVLYFLGGLVLAAFFVWLVWLINQVPADLVSKEFENLVFENGWKPGLSQGPYLGAIVVFIVIIFGSWWLLFRPTTREHFVRPSINETKPGE